MHPFSKRFLTALIWNWTIFKNIILKVHLYRIATFWKCIILKIRHSRTASFRKCIFWRLDILTLHLFKIASYWRIIVLALHLFRIARFLKTHLFWNESFLTSHILKVHHFETAPLRECILTAFFWQEQEKNFSNLTQAILPKSSHSRGLSKLYQRVREGLRRTNGTRTGRNERIKTVKLGEDVCLIQIEDH